jgi:hypothetical protein
MIALTKQIVASFYCYQVTDLTFTERITDTSLDEVYTTYKSYKQNEKQKRDKQDEPESNGKDICSLEPSLDTAELFYIDSLDTVTTEELVKCYGQLTRTGSEEDKHRYEYKFRFNYKDKQYYFSLYDWLNEDNEHYELSEIYWHLAANTKSKPVLKAFKQCVI